MALCSRLADSAAFYPVQPASQPARQQGPFSYVERWPSFLPSPSLFLFLFFRLSFAPRFLFSPFSPSVRVRPSVRLALGHFHSAFSEWRWDHSRRPPPPFGIGILHMGSGRRKLICTRTDTCPFLSFETTAKQVVPFVH